MSTQLVPRKRDIALVVRKVGLREKSNDFDYWQKQTREARLAALEEIRCEFHGYDNATEPRLQRVFTIVKR